MEVASGFGRMQESKDCSNLAREKKSSANGPEWELLKFFGKIVLDLKDRLDCERSR